MEKKGEGRCPLAPVLRTSHNYRALEKFDRRTGSIWGRQWKVRSDNGTTSSAANLFSRINHSLGFFLTALPLSWSDPKCLMGWHLLLSPMPDWIVPVSWSWVCSVLLQR